MCLFVLLLWLLLASVPGVVFLLLSVFVLSGIVHAVALSLDVIFNIQFAREAMV